MKNIILLIIFIGSAYGQVVDFDTPPLKLLKRTTTCTTNKGIFFERTKSTYEDGTIMEGMEARMDGGTVYITWSSNKVFFWNLAEDHRVEATISVDTNKVCSILLDKSIDYYKVASYIITVNKLMKSGSTEITWLAGYIKYNPAESGEIIYYERYLDPETAKSISAQIVIGKILALVLIAGMFIGIALCLMFVVERWEEICSPFRKPASVS